MGKKKISLKCPTKSIASSALPYISFVSTHHLAPLSKGMIYFLLYPNFSARPNICKSLALGNKLFSESAPTVEPFAPLTFCPLHIHIFYHFPCLP